MKRQYVVTWGDRHEGRPPVLVTSSLRLALEFVIEKISVNWDYSPFYKRCEFNGRSRTVKALKKLLPASVIRRSSFSYNDFYYRGDKKLVSHSSCILWVADHSNHAATIHALTSGKPFVYKRPTPYRPKRRK